MEIEDLVDTVGREVDECAVGPVAVRVAQCSEVAHARKDGRVRIVCLEARASVPMRWRRGRRWRRVPEIRVDTVRALAGGVTRAREGGRRWVAERGTQAVSGVVGLDGVEMIDVFLPSKPEVVALIPELSRGSKRSAREAVVEESRRIIVEVFDRRWGLRGRGRDVVGLWERRRRKAITARGVLVVD